MYDIFSNIRNNLESNRRIPTKTLLTLNPSSQVCFDLKENKSIGSCLRQIWFSKNDFEKSNIIPVSNISNLAGNWFESWFVSQLKETNLYFDSNFPATDVNRLVKGLVDIAFTNPHSNQVELGEIKTYDGSNYYNSTQILGNKSTQPKPKFKHLLQAFRYSLIFSENIKINNLFYIDRACSTWNKNKQFSIELVDINNDLYPKISTLWNNQHYEYVETSLSRDGIYYAEEKLLEYFSNNQVPPKDYIESYDESTITQKHYNKEIPDYLLDRYKKDPINNPIGASECRFCPFANGVCRNYEESL